MTSHYYLRRIILVQHSHWYPRSVISWSQNKFKHAKSKFSLRAWSVCGCTRKQQCGCEVHLHSSGGRLLHDFHTQHLGPYNGNTRPRHSPNFAFWTYITHSFVETHIWIVVVDIGVVILYGKLLEPLWGALEMLIFYGVVNTVVAFLTCCVYLFIYLATKNEEYLFDTHICGLAGYVAGFAVAVKQVMPDHVLVSTPFGKLRNKHIPGNS